MSSKAELICGGKYQMMPTVLGTGGWAKVFKGIRLEDGVFVAIKKINLSLVPRSMMEGIMNEVNYLKVLSHPKIVKYLDSETTDTDLFIILELVDSGNLADLAQLGRFPEKLIVNYLTQVLEGLVYLHEQGVIHQDIKGANILLTGDGKVKLADFGIAVKTHQVNPDAIIQGTPYWMAPEVVNLMGATTKSDIWSLGCTVVELLVGKPPWFDLPSMSALFKIGGEEIPPLPDGISSSCRDFLLKCFQKEPLLRQSAKELLKHPWITKFTKDQTSDSMDNTTAQEVVRKYETIRMDKKRKVENIIRQKKDSYSSGTRHDSIETSETSEKSVSPRSPRMEKISSVKDIFSSVKSGQQLAPPISSSSRKPKTGLTVPEINTNKSNPGSGTTTPESKSPREIINATATNKDKEKDKEKPAKDMKESNKDGIKEKSRHKGSFLGISLITPRGSGYKPKEPASPRGKNGNEKKDGKEEKDGFGWRMGTTSGGKVAPRSPVLRQASATRAGGSSIDGPDTSRVSKPHLRRVLSKNVQFGSSPQAPSDLFDTTDLSKFAESSSSESSIDEFDGIQIAGGDDLLAKLMSITSRDADEDESEATQEEPAEEQNLTKKSNSKPSSAKSSKNSSTDKPAKVTIKRVNTAVTTTNINSSATTTTTATARSDTDDWDEESDIDVDDVESETILQKNLVAEIAHDILKNIEKLSPTLPKADIQGISQNLINQFDTYPDQKELLLREHGVIPILDMLDRMDKGKDPSGVVWAIKIVNKITEGEPDISESLAIMGGIPAVSKYADERFINVEGLALEVAHFIQQLFYDDRRILKLFLASQGLATLSLLLHPHHSPNTHRIVLDSIEHILNVNFNIRLQIPKNDFCRVWVQCSILPKLVKLLSVYTSTKPTTNNNNEQFTIKICQLLFTFSRADLVVKQHFNSDVLQGIFGVMKSCHNYPSVVLLMLKILRNLASEDTMLPVFTQNPNTIKSLVEFLVEKPNPQLRATLLPSVTQISQQLQQQQSLPTQAQAQSHAHNILYILSRVGAFDLKARTLAAHTGLIPHLFNILNQAKKKINNNNTSSSNITSTNTNNSSSTNVLATNTNNTSNNSITSTSNSTTSETETSLTASGKRFELEQDTQLNNTKEPLEYALPIMFEFARTKAVQPMLHQNNGVGFFVSAFSLGFPYPAQSVESLAIWLNNDKKVGDELSKPQYTEELVKLFSQSPKETFEQLPNSYLKISELSKNVCSALIAKDFIGVLLKRFGFPDSLVRVTLVKLLTVLYKSIKKPKSTIEKYKLVEVLEGLEHDTAVLVRGGASELKNIIKKVK